MGTSRGTISRASVGKASHEVEQPADGEDRHAERDQPPLRVAEPLLEPEELGLGLDEEGSWASMNSRKSRARWTRAVPPMIRSTALRGSSQCHAALARRACGRSGGPSPPGRSRRTADGGGYPGSRASSDSRRCSTRASARAGGCSLEDVDRQPRIWVVVRLGGRPRRPARDPRASSPTVLVQERLVDPDQLPAGRPSMSVDEPGREPAHQLAHGVSTSPRNSRQLYCASESRTRSGSWPTIPKST